MKGLFCKNEYISEKYLKLKIKECRKLCLLVIAAIYITPHITKN